MAARRVVRRLLGAGALLVGVLVCSFVVFTVLPTVDPAAVAAGEKVAPELVEAREAQLGLDDPVLVRLGRSLVDALPVLVRTPGSGVAGVGVALSPDLGVDLGRSFRDDRPVLDELLRRAPVSLAVAAGAALLWFAVALALGVLGALRPGTWVDRLVGGVALLALCVPVAVLALVGLYGLGEGVGLLPVLPGQSAYGAADGVLGRARALVLPCAALALGLAAVYVRLVRGAMGDALAAPHLVTARAAGVGEARVVGRHALRVALVPVVALAGVDLGLLAGGAVLVEQVFNVPGLGRWAVDAARSGDLPIVQATVLAGAVAVLVGGLLADLATAWLDPRVRA